jgi:hypothetical protein
MAQSVTRMQGVAAREQHRQTAGDAAVANQQQPAAMAPTPAGTRQRASMATSGHSRLVTTEQANMEAMRGAQARQIAQQALMEKDFSLRQQDLTHRMGLQDAAEARAQALHPLDVQSKRFSLQRDIRSEGRTAEMHPLDMEAKKFSLQRDQEMQPINLENAKIRNEAGKLGIDVTKKSEKRAEDMHPINVDIAESDMYGKRMSLTQAEKESKRDDEMYPIKKKAAETAAEGQQLALDQGKKAAARQDQITEAYGPDGVAPSQKSPNSFMQEARNRGIDPGELLNAEGGLTSGGAALMEEIDRLKMRHPGKSNGEILNAAIKSTGVRTSQKVLQDEYEQLKQENIAEAGYANPRILRNESPEFHARVKRMKEIETKLKAKGSNGPSGGKAPAKVSYSEQVSAKLKTAKNVSPEDSQRATVAAQAVDDAKASGDIFAMAEATKNYKAIMSAIDTGN